MIAMDLDAMSAPDGPYWAAYQACRAREGITDDPRRVPAWFLARVARERVAAARLALEQLGHDPRSQVARMFGGEFHPGGRWDSRAAQHAGRYIELYAALRTVERAIEHGYLAVADPAVTQLVAGLLGADEREVSS